MVKASVVLGLPESPRDGLAEIPIEKRGADEVQVIEGVGPDGERTHTAVMLFDDEMPTATQVRLARLLLPHEGLADDVYAAVLNDALAAAADDESLTAVATLLNDHQSVDFMAIDEDAQLEAVRAIENDTSFADILSAVKAGMYNNPSVWAVINYEGPSYQNGGYLNRGAGDIDWLPGTD